MTSAHRIGVALAALVLVVGCAAAPSESRSGPTATTAPSGPGASGPTGTPAAPPVELTVFAAASLRDAFEALAQAYESTVAGVTITFSFDASSSLRAQIEQGAPVDVFASADTTNPQALVESGLAASSPLPFAGNRLAIVVPAANPAAVVAPVDLARAGVRVVNAGPEVPITGYAAEMLSNLARLPGYPPSFVADVAANVVSREDNVRAVLAKIELGEGDAAVVYATDALAAGDAVRTIPVPDEANLTATYAAVVPTTTASPRTAAAFLAWLAGPDARAVLEAFGFIVPAS